MKKLIRGLMATAALMLSTPVETYAQGGFVRLQPVEKSGTIDSTSDTGVIVLDSASVGGFGSVKVQTVDSYTGDWEVQCSLDGTNYDEDNELALALVDAPSTIVYSVSNTVGIWDVLNASGCRKIRVVPTGGFSGTDSVFVMRATQTGGSGGAGGGSGGGDFTNDTFNAAFGTAGSSNAQVLSVQGIASGTALPVSGSVTANAGTNLNTSALLTTAAHDGAFGTAGSADTQVRTVQGIASGTPIASNVSQIAGAALGATNYFPVRITDGSAYAALAGACTPGSIIGGASVNETEIKDTGGYLDVLTISSIDSVPVYIKLYDLDNDDLDENDTPIYRFGVPANSTAANGSGFVVPIPAGMSFTNAISFRITKGIADNSTTALEANEVLVSWCYR